MNIYGFFVYRAIKLNLVESFGTIGKDIKYFFTKFETIMKPVGKLCKRLADVLMDFQQQNSLCFSQSRQILCLLNYVLVYSVSIVKFEPFVTMVLGPHSCNILFVRCLQKRTSYKTKEHLSFAQTILNGYSNRAIYHKDARSKKAIFHRICAPYRTLASRQLDV